MCPCPSESCLACNHHFILLSVVMKTSHVYIMTSVLMTVLANEANEGDLQFSIARINARPGKGKYIADISISVSTTSACVKENSSNDGQV